VVAHQLEARIANQLQNVLLASGIEVVDAQDVVPSFDQTVAEMRTQKASAASYQHPIGAHVVTSHFISFVDQVRATTLQVGPVFGCCTGALLLVQSTRAVLAPPLPGTG